MKMYTGLLAVSLIVTGCASAPLPQTERETQSIVITTVTKQQGYDNLNAFLAKTIGDSNAAVKLRDGQSHIISRIAPVCNALKPTMDLGATYNVQYNLDAELKDQKARITLEALSYNRVGLDGQLQVHEISSGQMDDVRSCANDQIKMLTDAINGAGKKSSDF